MVQGRFDLEVGVTADQRSGPVLLRRLVGQGDDALAGHSAVISASAARAELSSQIDLLVA